MVRTADLEAALKFVTGRFEEQAMRSGEPLTEEQIFLLANLPSLPPGAMAHVVDAYSPVGRRGGTTGRAVCPSNST